MTPDNDLLERSLRHAVSDVDTPPDFTDRVLVGGRRRRFRRRAGMATAVAVVTVLVGGLAASTPAWLAGPDTTVPADPRMSEPTRGDLAKDSAFLDKVLSTWRAEGLVVNNMAPTAGKDCWQFTQPAHVHWAGTTPAGPAALVLQPIRNTPGTCDRVEPGSSTWLALIGTEPNDGAMHVLYTTGERSREVFAFGPKASTVLATEASGARGVSPKIDVGQDGTMTRRVQPLLFRDGVALHRIEAGAYVELDFVVTPELPDSQGRLKRHPLDMSLATQARYTGWPHKDWPRLRGALGGIHIPDDDGRRQLLRNALSQAGMTDPFNSPFEVDADWSVFAALPDGRTVGVTERYADSASHLYAVLFPGDKQSQEKLHRGEKVQQTVVYGGRTDQKAGHVLIRLPDKQGWILAAAGAVIRYRIGQQPWVPLGGEAALLPDDATEVQLSKQAAPGSDPVVTTIPLS
ncbi:hypothetical protein [Allokutzneria albata]|uniref:Uncharacterized protein n=1 Tax=Allokutzneria albata TaxID=211114 RepID=A0A1G9XT02_ALLAB|nr:hypothetical protein [Allokutzneria albata]SDM99942.1 hypothetical protein SAMN04489726_4394 [Allokutzneria albata]